MTTESEPDLSEWLHALFAAHDDRTEALQEAHRFITENGLLAKVTLLRYQCRRGCQIATVFRLDGTTMCAVRDYKLSPGLNQSQTVAAAREKNTLDGNRWWPSHVFDVDDLAHWGDDAGMHLTCRHYRGVVRASAVLSDVDGVTPGHQKRPVRLGAS